MILVTYDLKQPRRGYRHLIQAIQSLGDCWHILDSTWLISTNFTTSYVSGLLVSLIDSNDRLLVIEVDPSSATGLLSNEDWRWINSRGYVQRR